MYTNTMTAWTYEYSIYYTTDTMYSWKIGRPRHYLYCRYEKENLPGVPYLSLFLLLLIVVAGLVVVVVETTKEKISINWRAFSRRAGERECFIVPTEANLAYFIPGPTKAE